MVRYLDLSTADVSKITYLRKNTDGRMIPLYPYYDHESKSWEIFVMNYEGKLTKMVITELTEGMYFCKSPKSSSDAYLPFINFMLKRAYWKEITYFIESIFTDILNIAASTFKLKQIYITWFAAALGGETDLGLGINRVVITELEYLFMVCRSIYDLLQTCISKGICGHKLSGTRLGKNDPTFADIIFKNNEIRTKKELINDYSIPEPIAEYYVNQAVFFKWLRDYRDLILHGGKSIDIIYITEHGFAVSIDKPPFQSLKNLWSESNTIITDTSSRGMGSLESFVAYTIIHTLKALNDFVNMIEQLIDFPADVAPDYKVYLCSPHIKYISNLDKCITEEPWYFK